MLILQNWIPYIIVDNMTDDQALQINGPVAKRTGGRLVVSRSGGTKHLVRARKSTILYRWRFSIGSWLLGEVRNI
jgi:hypothetical protein